MTDREKSRRWKRAAVAALGICVLAAGATAAEAAWRHRHRHGGHHRQGHDLVGAVDWMLRAVDADSAQRDRVAAILEGTDEELDALMERHRGFHDAWTDALAGPEVDRAGLESLRAAELELADRASRLLLDAAAEAAAVLTPEQRAELLDLADHH